ncbi:MAG: Ku protein [Planctomycetaceae bacterium]|nr:Ku protein [Planctomycetaceae bacterium]
MAAAHRRRSSRRAAPKRGPRASWKGNLRFGLVSFSVQAFNAHIQGEGAVAFHQLHADCGRRIRYEKHCPVHGAVSNDEIVTAHEYAKGKYVEVDDAELDAMRTDAEKALTLDSFIEPEDFDPLYFDGRMYYLVPDGDAALEPFAVFRRALTNEDRYAVGQFAFSGKEQVAVVRPYGDVLHLALLNYAAEIRDAADVAVDEPTIRNVEKKVRMAEQIIRSWESDRFDFASYTDEYLERVRDLIDAKLKGRTIEAPEAEDEPDVVNLMDALKRSLEGKHGGRRSERHTLPHSAAAHRTIRQPKKSARRGKKRRAS